MFAASTEKEFGVDLEGREVGSDSWVNIELLPSSSVDIEEAIAIHFPIDGWNLSVMHDAVFIASLFVLIYLDALTCNLGSLCEHFPNE